MHQKKKKKKQPKFQILLIWPKDDPTMRERSPKTRLKENPPTDDRNEQNPTPEIEKR